MGIPRELNARTSISSSTPVDRNDSVSSSVFFTGIDEIVQKSFHLEHLHAIDKPQTYLDGKDVTDFDHHTSSSSRNHLNTLMTPEAQLDKVESESSLEDSQGSEIFDGAGRDQQATENSHSGSEIFSGAPSESSEDSLEEHH